MTIRVDNPQVSVVLFKMIQRKNGVAQRYAASPRQIDLTPYLGDGGSVQTVKTIDGSPGTFTISFPDQPNQAIKDSCYALIEPMDMVEIRMARNASLYDGGKLPLNMRGFVSNIRRAETMGDDGTPQRQVIISGQNFTKLWLINSVIWQVAYYQELPLLSLFQVDAVLGMVPNFQGASDFVTAMVGVMNKKVTDLAVFNPQVKPFNPVCTVTQGLVAPAMQSSLTDGSYWDILTAFQDSPWNELFIRENEAGPDVVYRPTPFKDLNGNFLNGADDPGAISVDMADCQTYDMARSDDQVANVFWTDPSTTSLDTNALIGAADIVDPSLLDFNYPNNNPTLYGYKQMQANTVLFPDGQVSMPSNLSGGAQSPAAEGFPEWWKVRAQTLIFMNRDNSVLESGRITIKGNENAEPGIYIRVRRGPITSEAYMTRVTQNFVPFQGYTTDITVERGNGFIKRDQFAGSPFWSEGRKGPYDATTGFVAKIAVGQVTPGSGS